MPAGVPFDRASLQRLSNRLHVSLSYPRVLLTSPELSYDVGLTASSEAFALRKVLRPRPTYSVEATYSLTKRLRFGGLFQRLAQPGAAIVKAFTQNSYSRISGFVLTPIATYTFNPVNRLDFLYHNSLFNPRKTEVRLGLGPSYARLTKETSVTWRYDKTAFMEHVSRHQRAIGLTSLVGLDFYPISSFSVSLTARTSVLPGVRLEAMEVAYSKEIPEPLRFRPRPRWLEGGTHTLHFTEIALGFRLHL